MFHLSDSGAVLTCLTSFSTPILKSSCLKVFPSIAIYRLLKLISWNLTTRCSAVIGVALVVLVNTADLAGSAGFWAHYRGLI